MNENESIMQAPFLQFCMGVCHECPKLGADWWFSLPKKIMNHAKLALHVKVLDLQLHHMQ